MARPRQPIFLQPAIYRRRRLIDAARLLPVFGAFMVIAPLLVLPAGQEGATSRVLVYLFGLWSVLILIAALIARHLRRVQQIADGRPDGRGEDLG